MEEFFLYVAWIISDEPDWAYFAATLSNKAKPLFNTESIVLSERIATLRETNDWNDMALAGILKQVEGKGSLFTDENMEMNTKAEELAQDEMKRFYDNHKRRKTKTNCFFCMLFC